MIPGKAREIEVVRCPTADMQPADLFTKALPAVLLSKHWDATRGETSPQVQVVACVVQFGSKLMTLRLRLQCLFGFEARMTGAINL
jgi:hypothetical protein